MSAEDDDLDDLDDDLDEDSGLAARLESLQQQHAKGTRLIVGELRRLTQRVTWLLGVVIAAAVVLFNRNSTGSASSNNEWVGWLLFIVVAVAVVVGLVWLLRAAVRGTAGQVRVIRAEWSAGKKEAAAGHLLQLAFYWLLFAVVTPTGTYLTIRDWLSGDG